MAVLLAAAFAAPAHASKGIYDVFGPAGKLSGATTGGAFERTSGGATVGSVAVNTTGAGGANPGDVYVADLKNNRIQRFAANGSFISAWGQDVIQAAAPGGAGTGFEICTVPADCKAGVAAGAGGAMTSPSGIAVNQQSGNVYVTGKGARVDEFSATGAFLRAWGKDVVSSGAEQADERQRLTVDATAGQYKLTFGANTTADIEWNEPAAGVQAKLNALASINTGGGSVTVTQGPNGPASVANYLIAFAGARADVNQSAIVIAAGSAPLSGGTGASIATLNDGAEGFEVCATAASCKVGVSSSIAGAFSTTNNVWGVAVAPQGAPNAGGVLVYEAINNFRIQEFTPTGEFVRSFGWETVSSGPDNGPPGFEVCNASALDLCAAGSKGAGLGQFGSSVSRLAEDSSGNLYMAESSNNFRVQKFTLPGNVVTPQGAYDPEGKLSGVSSTTTPSAVAVDTSTPPGTPGTLYVTKVFAAGTGTPPASVDEARILEVDPTGNAGAGQIVDTHAALGELNTGSLIGGLAVNLTSKRLYAAQMVLSATSGQGSVEIIDSVPPLSVGSIDVSEVAAATAQLEATITPSLLPSLHTLYHFEYAKVGTAGNCGEGAPGWRLSPEFEGDVGNGASPVAVSAEISNLQFEATYEFCLVAHTKFNGSRAIIAGPLFTTEATAPVVSTGVALWSSPPATGPSLLLGGGVNPGHDRTTYFFQYVNEDAYQADKAAGGDGFADAIAAPSLPAEAGRGTETVRVHESVTGLDPAKTYEFRLIATNGVGSESGDAHTVSPPSAADRFYELVSAGDSDGSGLAGLVEDISADGERATFTAQIFGQPPSLPGPLNPFASVRGPSGWQTSAMLPEPDGAQSTNTGSPHFFGGGLETTLWQESSLSERTRSEMQYMYVNLDGSRSAASTQIAPIARVGEGFGDFGRFLLEGASRDLSTMVFTTSSATGVGFTFVPGEPMLVQSSNLYQISGAGPDGPGVLDFVNRADGKSGAQIGGRCGAGLGARIGSIPGTAYHAISDDGSTVYFSARPEEPLTGTCPFSASPRRLFKRVDGEHTVAVSAPACTPVPVCPGSPVGEDIFSGASTDGSIVVFTSPRRLTDSDTDNTKDLYLYDENPPAGQPKLVQASAGEIAAGHPIPGVGAEVQDVVDNSADGSRVYFVANGPLTGANAEGRAPASGKPNLYVFERDDSHPTGRIAFIATLDSALRADSNGAPVGDPQLWGGAGGKKAWAVPIAGGAGDGHDLFFLSYEKILAEDTDDASDVYRYDDESEALLCLSCAGNGPFNTSIAPRVTGESLPDYAEFSPPVSDDGTTAAFVTPEALTGDDTNQGGALFCSTAKSSEIHGCDVYAWHEEGGGGTSLSLVTGGTEDLGIIGGGGRLAGVSADGRSILFITQAQLVASDRNNANDLYSARLGGGFPALSGVTSCGDSDQCQGPTASTETPASAASPGSASFSGPGNEATPKPCAKGKVRRHGKCVSKRRSHRHKHHQKRASNNRGGNR